MDDQDELDQDWGSDITGVADNQDLSDHEDVNAVRFSANVLTFSEMHQQQQLQRIVGSFGFVALPANPLAPYEAKARPTPRHVSTDAATEVADPLVEVPDIGGGVGGFFGGPDTVIPGGGATSSTDPLGGGVGGLFGSRFRLPDWCKRQKTAPADTSAPEEPPPEAPAAEEPLEEAPESQKPYDE